MSNCTGQVIHDGKIIGYVEYQGSGGMVMSRFFDTVEEVSEHWRTRPQASCTCGQPSVPILIWVEYARGFHWPSEACLACHAITGPVDDNDESFWADDGNDPWPKEGHPLGEEFETEWTRMCRE